VVFGVAGCGGSGRSDATVREAFVSGVDAIQSTPDAAKLQRRLVATIRALRRHDGSRDRGRELALAGFASTLHGVETQLSMRTHDSGRLEAAVRDAKRADRYLNRGARLLRSAGRELAVRVGKVNGR
jgi:hypothetical protein